MKETTFFCNRNFHPIAEHVKSCEDYFFKTANEKKEFWKAKAAAIKNETEMEKEEREQDEKDYQEMKKAVPGVVDRVIETTKVNMIKDRAASDARIDAWNDRLLHTYKDE